MRLSVHNIFIFSLACILIFISGCDNYMSEHEESYDNDYVSVIAVVEETRSSADVVKFNKGDKLTLTNGEKSAKYHLSDGIWISDAPLKWSEITKDAEGYYHFKATHDPSTDKIGYDNSTNNIPDYLIGKSKCLRNETPMFVLNHAAAKVTFDLTLDTELYWGDNMYVCLENILNQGDWINDELIGSGDSKDLSFYPTKVNDRNVIITARVVSQNLRSFKIGITDNDTREYYKTLDNDGIHLASGVNTTLKLKLIKGDLSLTIDKITISEWTKDEDVILGEVADQDVIYIHNEEELLRLKDMSELTGSSFIGKKLILANNITLKNPCDAYFGVNVPFRGTFDGNGHKIENYNINTDKDTDIGFFSKTNGATISNFKVVGNIASTSSSNYVGGIIGKATNNTIISNCSFEGSISSNSSTGSIAGYAKARITNCTGNCKIDISGNNVSVGGIVAENYGFIVGTTSHVIITVTGKNCYAGGIAGKNNYFIVSCKNEETITNNSSANSYTGVFVGYNNATIYACYSIKSGVSAIGTEGPKSVTGGVYAKASITVTEVEEMNQKVSLYLSMATFNNYPIAPYWTYENGSANLKSSK